MKKMKIIGYMLLLITIGACTKDKNNFSYEEPITFDISDEEAPDVIEIGLGQHLRLSPNFDDSKGDYSYLWIAARNNSAVSYREPRDTLSREKELETEISDFFILGEPYRLTFKVTDNKSGVSGFYFYDLRITNRYSEGWMVLEDKGGFADFSMLLPDTSVERGIYSLINPNYPIAEPLMLSLSSGSVTDDVSPTGRKLYVAGKRDAVELDPLTLQIRYNLDALYFVPPATKNLSFIGWSGTNLGVILNDGLLQANMTGGFPGAKKFGPSMQAPDVEYDYQIAPFTANIGEYNWRAHPIVYQHILYDHQNQRFYTTGGQTVDAFPTNASNPSIFDMNDVGLGMHYMGVANIANAHNAVMYEGTQPYLLQFSCVTTQGNPVITRMKQSMNAPYILDTEAANIASSSQSAHIFYGYENRLYRYGVNANSTSQLHTFPAGEEIINTKFRAIDDNGREYGELLVATWDGQESKLYLFSVSLAGLVGEPSDAIAGFDKIFDMVYKGES
ncbi:PKD-like family lipoprotein [Parapedobacter deserti]|uniref:PKD-like family lipoprotein n=1 Tax=Parapedobacter deserti TaxID=1912957 RepID=A0ABV7JSN3_9SPHI